MGWIIGRAVADIPYYSISAGPDGLGLTLQDAQEAIQRLNGPADAPKYSRKGTPTRDRRGMVCTPVRFPKPPLDADGEIAWGTPVPTPWQAVAARPLALAGITIPAGTRLRIMSFCSNGSPVVKVAQGPELGRRFSCCRGEVEITDPAFVEPEAPPKWGIEIVSQGESHADTI